MKTFNYIATLGFFLFAGCVGVTDNLPEDVSPNDVVRITASVLEPQSRAGLDSQSLSSFGLIITNETNAAYSYNTRMELKGSTWGTTDGLSMMWDTSRSPVTVTAFAPYTSGMSVDSRMIFSVVSNQTDAESVAASDLLLTKRSVDPTKDLTADGELPIVFAHAMSKLVVRVTEGGSADADIAKISNMALNGTIASGVCDLSAAEPQLTVQDNVSISTISLYKGATTHECILVPQIVSNLSLNFSYNGKLYIWSAPSAVTLSPGVEYTLTVNVGSSITASMHALDRATGISLFN